MVGKNVTLLGLPDTYGFYNTGDQAELIRLKGRHLILC